MSRQYVLFAGGGTGGHLYPALAVADVIREQKPEWHICFVGRPKSFEQSRVTQAGYDFVAVAAKGWSRSHMYKNLVIPFMLTASVLRIAVRMMAQRPKAVMGTGGYVSAPALAAARLTRVPVAIQEQNIFPGWVTRWASKFAQQVFLAHTQVKQYLPQTKGTVMTLGMPIRPIPQLNRTCLCRQYKLDPSRRILVVFGGSQGARTVNAWMQEGAAIIAQRTQAQIIWQTGTREWHFLQNKTKEMGPDIRITPYLDPMYDFLAMADLLLCRAGASTLAEATAFGVPALMVPLPHAADNHQEKNAQALEQAGAGFCLTEQTTDAQRVIEITVDLLNHSEKRQAMAQKSKALGRPDAAYRTAEEFMKLVEQGK